jgi:UDP-glucose 4-epimerase
MVTGGRGYVGQRILARLTAAGRSVVSFDRDPWEGGDGVTAVHGELHDVPRMVRVLSEHGIERVIHTASISHPDVSVAMPTATFVANAMGTINLLEAARLAGVARVVNFSSSSVYGFHDDRVDEDAPLRPTTPYGVSKVAADLLGPVYRDLYELDVATLRVFWVYGPGQKMPEYTHDFLRAAIDGQPYALVRGADHPLPMVYVDDVAAAAVCAADAATAANRAYNVAGPEWVTLGGLAERVRELVPGAQIEVGPGDLPIDQLGDHRIGAVDIGAARRDLGYEPQWTIERGLAAYADWLRANRY